jgi:hypothetical protein
VEKAQAWWERDNIFADIDYRWFKTE